MPRITHISLALVLVFGVAGCAPPPEDPDAPPPEFLGAEVAPLTDNAAPEAAEDAPEANAQLSVPLMGPNAVQPLEGDLIRVAVHVKGTRRSAPVELYAHCAAAQYADDNGYGFARHIRMKMAEESGLWRADAVYTISREKPRGSLTIDAKAALERCAEEGIPTV